MKNTKIADLEEKLKLLENVLDTLSIQVWIKDMEGRYMYANQAMAAADGVERDYLIGKTDMEVFNFEDSRRFTEADKMTIEVGKDYVYSYQLPEGRMEEVNKRIVTDEEGNPVGICGFARDITLQKMLETQYEKVKFITEHDVLTGLHNRAYYIQRFNEIDKEGNLPISVIMCDINGLKLSNDIFGHARGDEIIKKTAEALKESAREGDLIARIGGDEFIMVLPRTTAMGSQRIISQIRKKVEEFNQGFLIFSVAMGQATKTNMGQGRDGIVSDAETHMYLNKVIESRDLGDRTIEILKEYLFTNDAVEAAHLNSVSSLCKKMGEAMGLSEREVTRLSDAGLLHDIGKVAISDGIVSQREPLTPEQWYEVRRHPEIGARIVKSTSMYSSIADCIMHHHERVDGGGYPEGLSGNRISLEAKVIAIADAYDSMVSPRSYKQAMSSKEAIEELRAHKDTQFDGELTEIFISKVIGE